MNKSVFGDNVPFVLTKRAAKTQEWMVFDDLSEDRRPWEVNSVDLKKMSSTDPESITVSSSFSGFLKGQQCDPEPLKKSLGR